MLNVFLVVVALRFARDVFLPIGLAILFSFLLSPLVSLFRRWHLGRIPSVFIAVLIAFAILGSLATFMEGQIGDLAHRLPEYQENFHKKVKSFTEAGGGVFGRLFQYQENLRKELIPATNQTNAPSAGRTKEKPATVEVQNPPFSPLTVVKEVLGSLFSLAVMLFIVVVFVIFMLIERDDLRDRLIRLFRAGKPETSTSELLDEASDRVSRYLLMQLLVNVCYAIPIGAGLYFIGIPNPLLWGMLSGLLRYIPYIGPWIAMAMPFTLALAVDPDWSKPLMVLGLFGVVELIVANAVEPWLYGSSTGITPLAVLVAAVFWTWLWGPVGLLLSTPLTVCFVSLGRYIPSLKWLDILFGDEPRSQSSRNQAKGNSGSGASS